MYLNYFYLLFKLFSSRRIPFCKIIRIIKFFLIYYEFCLIFEFSLFAMNSNTLTLNIK